MFISSGELIYFGVYFPRDAIRFTRFANQVTIYDDPSTDDIQMLNSNQYVIRIPRMTEGDLAVGRSVRVHRWDSLGLLAALIGIRSQTTHFDLRCERSDSCELHFFPNGR
jgi:hypothetical protein